MAIAMFSGAKKGQERLAKYEEDSSSKQLRAFGLAPEELQEKLAEILDDPDINCVGISTPTGETNNIDHVVNKVAAMPIDLLVLYVSDFTRDMQQFMESYHDVRKGVTSILLTEKEIDVDMLQVAMACGINKAISTSVAGKHDIQAVIMAETRKGLERGEKAKVLNYKSRVIVTYSSKGGVGKTTISVNLAAALTQLGNKVTIIDLDLASGDVHSFLAVNNAESLSELAEEPNITPATIKRYVQNSSCGIGVMCAPSAPQHASIVQPELIEKVITTLRAENDYVIVDCDQQLINGTIAQCNDEAMKAADLILFVVAPEVPTINGAYDMLHKYLDRYSSVAEKIRVVVNKAGSASTITPDDIAKTLEKPVFAVLPDDYNTIVPTLNTAVPFMHAYGQSRTPSFLKPSIVKAYEQLRDKIVEIT